MAAAVSRTVERPASEMAISFLSHQRMLRLTKAVWVKDERSMLAIIIRIIWACH